MPQHHQLGTGNCIKSYTLNTRKRYTFFVDPANNTPPNGESQAQFSPRVEAALLRVLQAHKGKRIALDYASISQISVRCNGKWHHLLSVILVGIVGVTKCFRQI